MKKTQKLNNKKPPIKILPRTWI